MPPAITHYRIALIRRRVYLGLKEMINIVFFVYSIKLLFFFLLKKSTLDVGALHPHIYAAMKRSLLRINFVCSARLPLHFFSSINHKARAEVSQGPQIIFDIKKNFKPI